LHLGNFEGGDNHGFNKLTAPAFKHLGKVLPKLQEIEEFRFKMGGWQHEMDDEGLGWLAEGLRKCSKMKNLMI